MGGNKGILLRINLTEKTIKTESLNRELREKYLGGRGLAGKMFTDEVPAEVEAFSPENKVFIAAGTLTGTKAPTSGRFVVVTKSPLNGTLAASNSGGFWGPQLKFAGYDMVVLEGKADTPVYLSIHDDKVEIKDASHIWGKDVYETTSMIKAEFGNYQAKVLTIGPAGESLSLMASVMNDLYRAAGRNGVGAVMGSKNIKAILVRGTGTGTGKVEPAETDKMNRVVTDILKTIQANGVTGQGLPTYGTAILVNIMNENGVYPVNNFQESYDAKADQMSGETMTEKYLIKKESCYQCPIACGRYCHWNEGEGGGPEYETVWVFGSNCGVQDYDAIHQANDLCNKYGLDTISVGATIAAGMELVQRGYIKAQELEGTPLEFGHAQGMVEWIRKIAYREGLGAKMALGSYRFAESYGAAELSMSVKKQELPACDPRGVQGQGLSYATSNRGGCHVRGYVISPEIQGGDRFGIEGKAKRVKISQDLSAVIDSVGLCLFSSFALGLADYKRLINAITGLNYTEEELLACGERIWNNERLHNLRVGYTKADDTLPKRFLKEPITDGPSKGHIHRLDELLPEYYTVRGWDREGVPIPERLSALGMG